MSRQIMAKDIDLKIISEIYNIYLDMKCLCKDRDVKATREQPSRENTASP